MIFLAYAHARAIILFRGFFLNLSLSLSLLCFEFI